MRPWSYSRLTTWEECPMQYRYYYIEKLPGSRPPSPAGSRGSEIHKKAELYLLDELKLYPPELQKVSAHAMMLKSKKAKPEVKLAVKEDWTPVDYDSPDVYFRCIIDVHYQEETVCHVQDWKTGKVYDSHADQLEIYVAVAAAHAPTETTEYRSRPIYIDQGFVATPKIVTPDRIKPIRLLLNGRIKNAEADTIFPTRAGPHCKWCDYSSRHGGPCQF